MDKKTTINSSILLLGMASGIFAGFCPSWFTVASPFFHAQDAKAGNIKRIRWGEISATAIVLALGVAVSDAHNSPIPFIAAALISAIFVAGYEYMIAHPAIDG
jgi:hypothetical protein